MSLYAISNKIINDDDEILKYRQKTFVNVYIINKRD